MPSGDRWQVRQSGIVRCVEGLTVPEDLEHVPAGTSVVVGLQLLPPPDSRASPVKLGGWRLGQFLTMAPFPSHQLSSHHDSAGLEPFLRLSSAPAQVMILMFLQQQHLRATYWALMEDG